MLAHSPISLFICLFVHPLQSTPHSRTAVQTSGHRPALHSSLLYGQRTSKHSSHLSATPASLSYLTSFLTLNCSALRKSTCKTSSGHLGQVQLQVAFKSLQMQKLLCQSPPSYTPCLLSLVWDCGHYRGTQADWFCHLFVPVNTDQ